ncbi:subtilase protease [Haloferax elongans ATCC BAA-1513]|uniref:Subtilase protease n=1 Tax=Haloferax elongans ATCC BAA-1513 TaxID=1230453 RepID=M0HJF3_HALEO|nr:subtilase protease [Haloferax elongans ATCC BAA-1513]
MVAILVVTAGFAWVSLSNPHTVAGELRGPKAGPADTVPVDSDTFDVPTGVEHVHERGVTGEGVTVGIVDVTGFDTDNPALDGRVSATKAFGKGSRLDNGGVNHHGTAAAVTIAKTAPDADLALAKVDSATTTRKAIQWLSRQNADVIVLQFSALGVSDDGRSGISQAVTRASEQGAVVVAPTGNLAQGHWEGQLRPTARSRHQFPNSTAVRLKPLRGERVETAGPIDLWLTWNTTSSYPIDLSLTVYRHRPTTFDKAVATSESVRDGSVAVERLRATLQSGVHYVVVDYGDSASASAAAASVTFEVSSPTNRFNQTRENGSITAPATARNVVSVGAYNQSTNEVEPYSGRGPTADGRVGVDVVAPAELWTVWPRTEKPGTSTAAAYTGGVAALVFDVVPEATPAEVERSLELGAASKTQTPTVRSGYGVVDPVASVELAIRERPFGDGESNTDSQ